MRDRKVAVVGVGLTKVGEHWNMGLEDLFVEASTKALDDAGVNKIDALYVGNMLGMFLRDQGHLGAYLADKLGFPGIHAVRVEAGCASGGVALAEAVIAVKSGRFKYVLVSGVEKMTDCMVDEVTYGLMFAEDLWGMEYSGATFIGLNAMLHRLYMRKYNVTDEEMMALPVQSHENALKAKHAMFKRKITIRDAINSPYIADPIRLYDASPICDGAASLVICPLEEALRIRDNVVEIAGSSVKTQVMSVYERKDMLWFEATNKASSEALREANLTINDIDLFEIHDAFTITGILSLEAIGVFKRGEAARKIALGHTRLDSERPVNTFGGLKARGHPVGATGVYQAVEAVLQLRGEAGGNQVKGAETALIQNIGGVDSTAAVHVLRRLNSNA